MADLGPERRGHTSETRQWSDGQRTAERHHVSNRRFIIVLLIILAALVAFAFLR